MNSVYSIYSIGDTNDTLITNIVYISILITVEACIIFVSYLILFAIFLWSCSNIFFFFQAEDGIRDWSVTGVQTRALPILSEVESVLSLIPADQETKAKILAEITPIVEPVALGPRERVDLPRLLAAVRALRQRLDLRSEERRVGKECRSGGVARC